MASLYILYSSSLDKFYVGSCMDLSYRMVQHVNKEFTKSFTTKAEDWVLYYFKDDLGYQQVRSIEQHIKKMKSRGYIKNLKAYPEIMKIDVKVSLMTAPIVIGVVDALVSNSCWKPCRFDLGAGYNPSLQYKINTNFNAKFLGTFVSL